MAQVVLENLYKTFPQTSRRAPDSRDSAAVLRRINLEIEAGEFMVLVGPSGCGKSTLLRLIAGLEDITGGTITIGDRPINHLPPKQRDIAMVFQNYALYPHLNVYQNLAFGLRRMGPGALQPAAHSAELPDAELESSLARALAEQSWWQAALTTATRPFPKSLRYRSKAEQLIDQRIHTVAQMLQIDALLHRLPRQLSGGQKQRVALGRAMARNPQVFLMDEPLSNLDAKLRNETRAQIVALQRQLGVTTIYVTHDQVEAMTMGDRIAVMNQGQIQQVATPLELYNQPANQFVAAFIGSPPMNFLTVEVKAAPVISHPLFRLTLPSPWEDILRPYDGQTLILGIRPEHLSLSLPAPKNLPVRVARVEALGCDTFLSLTLGDHPLQARIEPERWVRPGEELWLSINPDRVHLFHPATGNALPLPTR